MPDIDEYVKALEQADDAMQQAIKHAPENEMAQEVTVKTFRSVRATHVMGLEMKREAAES